MVLIRKIALGLLLAASVAVLGTAAVELWNYRQWAAVVPRDPGSTLDSRARLLQDRMDLLSKRVGDMELLVLVLLGTSGLYAIVFVASSYFSATNFARQADRTITHIRDEVGLALGDLRELQEETEQKLAQAPGNAAGLLDQMREEARALIREEMRREQAQLESQQAQLDVLAARIASGKDRNFSDQAVAEFLETAGGAAVRQSLAALYREFAQLYAATDAIRAKFYLDRALQQVAPDSPLASKIRYDLACWFTGARDFERALRELAAAFQHQSKALDDRLAADLEEGGRLYPLASTPPFDKAVNDLLLNMSIGTN
ncbi:MAG TPA: hypothetical protein VMB25_06805 [Bryobacteraceae bacterium]|nr:hypothetical protein [Bryobacteraceae bacterium]